MASARSDVTKTRLDSLLSELRDRGWTPGLKRKSYAHIADCGFRGKNLALASVATEIALEEHPLTLRGLFYRVVSAGWLPSTDKQHYDRLGRILGTLRESGVVPFHWIVDNLRSTVKPSSWSGLTDFAETVRDAYRKDFWDHLPDYVHVFCEKDAIAGVIEPVTREYDVALSPCRGYASLSFAHAIAEQFNHIEKPIHCVYLGDFDASGFDIERDLVEKLRRYVEVAFSWQRLAINASDFADFNLISLAVKRTDTRYQKFVEEHGEQCAELDALPATEIRRRVTQAILEYIPQEQWERLQNIERLERESFNVVLGRIAAGVPNTDGGEE